MALAELGVPFVIWHERAPVRRAGKPLAVHVGSYSVGMDDLRRELDKLSPHGPFTHVIAGSEAALFCASMARGVLGARRSRHAVAMRCRDKLVMKRRLARRGIPMTEFFCAAPDADPKPIIELLGSPVVVKQRRGSGGRGITITRSVDELSKQLSPGKIAERFVDGPEASVESFISGGQVLFVSTTEYYVKAHVNIVPAGICPADYDALLQLNQRVIEALGIEWGVTHLEVYRTPGGYLFGEIALRPPGGYIMELISLAWEFDAWRAFVSVELDLPGLAQLFPRRGPQSCAASVIFHPGAGTVSRVSGLNEIKAHPAVVSARMKVKAGDHVGVRAGVGEDVGYVQLRAAGRAELLEAIAFVSTCLKVEL
jgi:hypothetical protein